jgi:ribose 5-phosphate isomerase B
MSERKVVLGADHGGYTLKQALIEHLNAQGFVILDMGADTLASCDFPVYGRKVCDAVLHEQAPGILICGTGVGMCMVANKVKGIRAAICTNEYMARMSRLHNNANVLCLGERVLGLDLAKSIVDVYLATDYEGGRHQRRLDMFE